MGYSSFGVFGDDGEFVGEEDVIIGDDLNEPGTDNANNEPDVDEGEDNSNEYNKAMM